MIEGPHDVVREFAQRTKINLSPEIRNMLQGLIQEYGMNCEKRVKDHIKAKFATWIVDWE